MSLFDIARDTLKDLPISDILRERLSLSLDLAAQAELKHEDTKLKLARVEALLENERVNHQQTRQAYKVCQEEYQRLKDEHAEEIRVHSGIEFRRGKRTGGAWLPFCPVCHTPADTSTGLVKCGHPKCGWGILVGAAGLADATTKLPGPGHG